MKPAYFIIIISVCLGSCKKDKLKDEKAFLIGTWNWIYTEHDYNWCNPPGLFAILDPQTENSSYSVEFIKKGEIKFYKNNNLLETNRIVFDYFTEDDFGNPYFSIRLDNDKNDKIAGGGNDTIWLNKFPFLSEPGCESYKSFFIKE